MSSLRDRLQKAVSDNERVLAELEKQLAQNYAELQGELKRQADAKDKKIALNEKKLKAAVFVDECGIFIKQQNHEYAELERRIDEEEKVATQLMLEQADVMAKHIASVSCVSEMCLDEFKANSYSNVNSEKEREAAKQLLMMKAIKQRFNERGLYVDGKKKDAYVAPCVNDDKANRITFLLNETNNEMKKVMLQKKRVPQKFWS
uniref:Phage protein n=1 Tax=Steinernema glaseri TaxID=37863 RepID=A0A1I7Y009_9BILA